MNRRGCMVLGAILMLVVGLSAAAQAGDQPTPIVRGPHVSGAVRYQPANSAATSGPGVSCSRPGAGNYLTNCNGKGRPVNETWIAANGSFYVAGANDYNSYNGQGQDGFYWLDPTTVNTNCPAACWTDGGPIDAFPHNTNNGAGDPGLALGTDGSGHLVAYYSSLFYNFNRCNVGGVELITGTYNSTAKTWSWASPVQFAANSRSQFQDKPAIALDASHSQVFESWTQFGSCSGVGVTSPIRVAVVRTASPSSFTTLSNVPGSTYPQGSSIVADGAGGFWLAWEEYPSSSATIGIGIRLAHWTGSAWASLDGAGNRYVTVSPATYEDLASPLSGFSFRDNSFPALTLVSGVPAVTWTAFDTTQDPVHGPQTQKGRDYVFFAGSAATPLTGSTLLRLAAFGAAAGGHQFFPAIAPSGTGVFVSYSQENLDANLNTLGSYDQWVAHVTPAGIDSGPAKRSTASSFPNADKFFSGQFIGDYNGLAAVSGVAHPIWTDLRGPDPFYATQEMDSMTAF